MKVTLDKNEIQEAVQHYISNVLGSSLLVSEIAVIQGRESNGARIEIDLYRAEPIDLDNGEMVDNCVPVEEPIDIPEPVKAIQEGLPSLNDISLMFVPFYAYFSLTLTYFFMRKQSFPTSLEFFKFKALYNYSPELPLF